MKRFGILLVLLLCGCQTAMELAEVTPRENREAIKIQKTRPIAYDSASIDLKRGTLYAVYPEIRLGCIRFTAEVKPAHHVPVIPELCFVIENLI